MAEFESTPSCHNDIDVLPTQKSGVMEFRAERLPPPNYSLPGLGTPKGAHFDPDVHLQLEPPAFVKDLNFKDVPFPYRKEDAPHRGNLAYTQPFRVLSGAIFKIIYYFLSPINSLCLDEIRCRYTSSQRSDI